jgi:hypothetical protein
MEGDSPSNWRPVEFSASSTSTPITRSKALRRALIDLTSTVSGVTMQTVLKSTSGATGGVGCTSLRLAARTRAPGRYESEERRVTNANGPDISQRRRSRLPVQVRDGDEDCNELFEQAVALPLSKLPLRRSPTASATGRKGTRCVLLQRPQEFLKICRCTGVRRIWRRHWQRSLNWSHIYIIDNVKSTLTYPPTPLSSRPRPWLPDGASSRTGSNRYRCSVLPLFQGFM